MKIKYIGLLVGLIVGIVWMWLGFEKLVVVLVFGVVGYVIGRILEGELDVQRFIDDLRRR
jgi:uncharacterized membrane protein